MLLITIIVLGVIIIGFVIYRNRKDKKDLEATLNREDENPVGPVVDDDKRI